MAMNRINVPRNSRIVVCDAAKAIILRNTGDAFRLDLRLEKSFESPQPVSRELGTDRPGRVHQSFGPGRSAVEITDWHMAGELAFLGKVADEVEQLARDKKVKHVIIVSPPKALGIFRKRLSANALALVKAEIAKDLVQMPIADIEHHLSH